MVTQWYHKMCSQPSGFVTNGDDCNDNEPLAWTNGQSNAMVSTMTVTTASTKASSTPTLDSTKMALATQTTAPKPAATQWLSHKTTPITMTGRKHQPSNTLWYYDNDDGCGKCCPCGYLGRLGMWTTTQTATIKQHGLPRATEYCDGINNNCDNVTMSTAVDAQTWYQDVDGQLRRQLESISACNQPAGYYLQVPTAMTTT